VQAEGLLAEELRERLDDLIKEGERRGALTLVGVHEVEEGGEDETRSGGKADARIEDGKLHIHVKAAVDGVEVEREWTFFRDRYGVRGCALTRADAPGGRETDVKRLQVLSQLLFDDTGNLISDGKQIQYTRRHLEHAARFKDIIEKWLHKNQTEQNHSHHGGPTPRINKQHLLNDIY